MPLTDDDRAELVAYLDGELDEQATQAVEARLATDVEARAELDTLKQTWGMLDYLPRAEPSPSFTHRTLEKLTLEQVGAVSGSKSLPILTPRRGPSWAILGWVASLLLAAGAGYWSAQHFFPAPSPQVAIPTPAPEVKEPVSRELSEQDWLRRQPKAMREAWSKLPSGDRADFVKMLRKEEEQWHQQWEFAARFWRELEGQEMLPSRLSDFSPKVQKYVQEYLMTLLLDDEKKQLAKAEGRWPDYAQALAEIGSRHPAALPPPRKEALPHYFVQLPIPIQQRVSIDKKGVTGKRILNPKLQSFNGSPTFVSKVVELGTNKGKIPFENEFWACNFRALRPPMKDFVENQLLPALNDNADKKKLSEYEGSWPFYPQTIQELAQKYHLHPPWFTLPEAEKYHWDRYLPQDKPGT